MKLLNPLYRLFWRFRYPVSMPEEVARDLGLGFSNFLTFKEFVGCLVHPMACPNNLKKFMPRCQAEEVFRSARRKEKFTHNSLYSYYFSEGWMEFILQFDEQSRLRRLYIQHKDLKRKVEIPLG